MRTAFSLLLFFYCLNFGLYFIGSTFSIDSIIDLNQIDFETERENLRGVANETAEGANFGEANPFGNFSQGLDVFWGLLGALGGGAILNVLGALGLPDAFIIPLQVIVIITVVFALIYIITGRASEFSA